MSSCKPSGERRLALRGMTVLELLVAQTIALIIITGLVSLIVGLTKSLHAQNGASDAQVRLRESTHIMLRDLQGLGGEERTNAVDLFFLTDGGTTGADSITVFKRDTAICGGALTVSGTPTSATTSFTTPCAISTGTTGACTKALLTNRQVAVRGATRTIVLKISGVPTVDASNCKVTLTADTGALARYQALYPTPAVTTIDGALANLGPGVVVMPGNTLEYRIGTMADPQNASIQIPSLERKRDSETDYTDILEYVYDLQFMRGFDISGDGVLQENEYENSASWVASTTTNASQFIGMRIGIVAYGKAKDGVATKPPATFGNRLHPSPPTGLKYRTSIVFAAARNP